MIVVYILLGITLAVGIVLIVGCTFDKERTHTKEGVIEAPIQKVWDTVTKFDEQVTWRKDIKEVIFLSNDKWMEIPYSGQDLTYKIVESKPLEYWILDIYMGDKYVGYWAAEFTPIEGKTLVVLTEVLISKNPLMRVISRLFLNMDKSMMMYMDSLVNACTNIKQFFKNFVA